MSMGWKGPYTAEQSLADIRDLLLVLALQGSGYDQDGNSHDRGALDRVLARRLEEKGPNDG